MNLIDGKALAADIREQVKREITELGLHPKLGVLLVGDDPSSHIYVNLKEKAAKEAGIETDIRRLLADTSDEELKNIIEDWNDDEKVDAILIQIPLPAGHDTDALIATMDPRKDVDGFHPQNLAAINSGQSEIFPPVHESILHLIAATGVDLRNAKALIISNSDIFADPLTRLLSRAGSAVDRVRPDDFINDDGKEADIIVIAIGRAGFLKSNAIKPGACVIDVGTNRPPNGKVVGDVDAESVKDLP
ncbi:bifunctional 5,10-methylenetetrahydrofolate dehydrogenase/5,10-methenyltetrahydrofolate cyclohydrolase, partial [Patescibacteria group bacterium]|nr:bifunctional 5,10-methylenetetrahydrofolate dehydrogenase/5,10-methenyltetrahydrofolate cyclohydrolase [Patescibacteria group bacterium]